MTTVSGTEMRNWIKRNQAYIMIGLLAIIARAVHVVIFMYFDDMKDFLGSIFGFFGNSGV